LKGKFQTNRSIFSHGIWQNITEFRIFFYLYGSAVFSEEGVTYGDVHIKRGQLLKSYRALQDALAYIENHTVKKYSISTIKRTVDKLVKQGRITIEAIELGTLFTILNYEMYQGFDGLDNTGLGTPTELGTDAEHLQPSDGPAFAEQTHGSGGTDAEQMRNNNKKDKNVKENILVPVPYAKIQNHFNEICKSYSKVISVTDKRQMHLKARWGQFGGDINKFIEAFTKIENSSFCKGVNKRNWKASFDWVIANETNMVKVLEDKYINEKGGKPIDPKYGW